MTELVPALEKYGLWIVFANTLLQQLGLPIPVLPTLVMAGALSINGQFSAVQSLLVAVVASLIADALWYAAGRRYGYRVLRVLCRLSISPESCVRSSEDLFTRWGAIGILGSKFIPGVSTVAPPIAGAMHMPIVRFLIAAAAAAGLYAGVGLGFGMIFHQQLDAALGLMEDNLRAAALVLISLIGLYVASKLVRRWLFGRQLRMARISVAELRRMSEAGAPLVILDVRPRSAREREPGLPGALGIDADRLEQHLEELKARITIDLSSEIVLYCACPSEASAVAIAHRLARHGFKRLRPLAGGLDAWVQAGLPVSGA